MTAPRGLLFTAAATGALALVLCVVMAIDPAPLGGEASISRNFQELDWFESIASFVNTAGNANTWILYGLPIPAWVLSKVFPRDTRVRDLLWIAVLMAVAGAVNPLLKEIIQSPRPSAEYGIAIDRVRDSYGFPSGHVTSGILLFGSIAAFCWRIAPRAAAVPVVVAAGVMIVLSGPSRVFAGAHWTSDVTGGYLAGTALICAGWALFLASTRRMNAAPVIAEPVAQASKPAGSGAAKARANAAKRKK